MPEFAVIVRAKARGHHPDDRVFLAVEEQLFSDHSAVGRIMARPESMSENDDVFIPRFRVLRTERASE